jgi:hypothetical protein
MTSHSTTVMTENPLDEVPDVNIRAESPERVAAIIQRLQTIAATKEDYNVPGRTARMITQAEGDAVRLRLVIDHGGVVGPTAYRMGSFAHSQLATKLGIPGAYYTRMGREAPDLLCRNVNTWLHQQGDKLHTVRTLDGSVRAWLSNRYHIVDSTDLAFATLDAAEKVGAKVVRADLTEERLHLRVLHDEWKIRINHQQAAIDEAPKGGGFMQGFDDRGGIHKQPGTMPIARADAGAEGGIMHRAARDYLIPGVSVSNSDVGVGKLRIEPFIYMIYCRNGAMFGHAMAKVHIGSERDIEGLLSQETIAKSNEVLFDTIRDVIGQVMNLERFKAYVAMMEQSTAITIENPTKVVDTVVKDLRLSEDRKQMLLNNLLAGGDNTVYGMMNAITAVGREETDYNEGVRLERAGVAYMESELVRVRS